MQIIRYRMKRQQGPTGWHRELLQGGEPLWGPEACLKLRTVLSRGTLMLTGERLPWEGVRRWRTGEKGKPGELLCHMITVSGFRVMGLVSSLSPASPSDVRSFLVVIHSPNQDGIQRGWFWEFAGTYGMASPVFFGLFMNSSSWWWLVTSIFLTRTSCLLMQMFTMEPGLVRGFQSIWKLKKLHSIFCDKL